MIPKSYLVPHSKVDRVEKMVREALNLPTGDEPIPDLLWGQFEKPTPGGLWKPKIFEDDDCYYDLLNVPIAKPATLGSWVSYRFNYTVLPPPEPKPVEPDSAPFELNLTEALVGWRAWKVHPVDKLLTSQYDHRKAIDGNECKWRPNVPFEAECGKKHDHAVPAEFCTCGIYAADSLKTVQGYTGVYGEVYGWGRYVRGDAGWRAQYAYPKKFYLTADYARSVSPETIEILKSYKVPIVMEQPILFYNPEEDGYEHRENDQDWNLGTGPEPDAEED